MAAETSRRRLPSLGVAGRLVVAVVAAAALGMLVAGLVALWVQERVVERRVDASLVQEVEELRAAAAGRQDGDLVYSDVTELLSDVLRQNVPDSGEGNMVLVDGEIALLPGGQRTLRLEELPELQRRVAGLAAADDPVIGSLVADVDGTPTDLRYVAVPVSVPGDARTGVLVTAVDVDAARAQVRSGAAAYLLASLAALAIVALVGSAVAGRLLRPLQLLSDTARRLTEEDLSQRIPVRGHDEVSALTRTVNGMLERLERAFVGQRQLLDDVGHELRTPLTVVRGHVELMDPEDPADVRETQELALDELDRMHRLVDDLVLLAQSQRPDFLRWGVVDVDQVVERTLDRVRALGDRRWRLDATSGVSVPGDSQRLVQALMQLTSNAVRHTGPDDEVALGAAVEGDVVRLWVRDTGPGVAEADKERIFARAQQGQALAPRPAARDGETEAAAHEGSGLGLAIVTAIAEAHGGRVTLSSTAGAGAVFAVELPLPRTAEPAADADDVDDTDGAGEGDAPAAAGPATATPPYGLPVTSPGPSSRDAVTGPVPTPSGRERR